MEASQESRQIARIVCSSQAMFLQRLEMLKTVRVVEVFRDQSQHALIYAIIGEGTLSHDKWPVDIRRAGVTDKLTVQDLRSGNYERICFAKEARARV
jgi:hypothetical protein